MQQLAAVARRLEVLGQISVCRRQIADAVNNYAVSLASPDLCRVEGVGFLDFGEPEEEVFFELGGDCGVIRSGLGGFSYRSRPRFVRCFFAELGPFFGPAFVADA